MDGVSGGAEQGGWDVGCGLGPRFCVWGCGRARARGRSYGLNTQPWPPTVRGRQFGGGWGVREGTGEMVGIWQK